MKIINIKSCVTCLLLPAWPTYFQSICHTQRAICWTGSKRKSFYTLPNILYWSFSVSPFRVLSFLQSLQNPCGQISSVSVFSIVKQFTGKHYCISDSVDIVNQTNTVVQEECSLFSKTSQQAFLMFYLKSISCRIKSQWLSPGISFDYKFLK